MSDKTPSEQGEPRSIFSMTAEERRAAMEANPPVIEAIHHANVYFDWSWNGCGFGQLSFLFDRNTGKIECMNECMSRERVRALLHALVDHVADNMELDT